MPASDKSGVYGVNGFGRLPDRHVGIEFEFSVAIWTMGGHGLRGGFFVKYDLSGTALPIQYRLLEGAFDGPEVNGGNGASDVVGGGANVDV